MNHIAIDLGSTKSQFCIRSTSGAIVAEGPMRTRDIARFLRRQDASRVVVETCSESFHVADLALGLGHEVRVVPASLVKSLGVGARGIKTDERDAQTLSEVSTRIDLPSVHIPRRSSRRLKTVCGMRNALVETRTKLINTVRGWLRGNALRIRGGSSKSFVVRVYEAFVDDPPACVERQLRAIDALTEEIEDATKEVESTAQEAAPPTPE